MQRVCIGIPVRERADSLMDTVQSLRRLTMPASIVALCDGADRKTRSAADAAHCDHVFAWDHTRGDPHCFNRLVGECNADAYVLLENGARVAPHAIERMVGVLALDPTHGLAGPSTNRAWNEQKFEFPCGGSAEEVARVAAAAVELHGDAFATLEPLHSLGDFCYVVTRSVVDRIGAADEGYGKGPCWEMAYNVRAARAGFRAVWVKAAYVWRAASTLQQRSTEARWFAASKRRYQDQFCALHLRGETTNYEDHCKGEACAHFAPRERIALHYPLAGRPIAPGSTPRIELPSAPLVSCIMPTADRRALVPHAIRAFLRQDYDARELVIVDDGVDAVGDLVPDDPRVRYVRSPRRQSLGAKRNEACRLARGALIAHWDDDDWHAPWRLSYQVSQLCARRADICGLDHLWFYEPDQDRAWQYRFLGARGRWLAGGTFCYRKSLWERLPFADVSAGEDTRFVRKVATNKLLPLERDDFYVARIHGANSSSRVTSAANWQRASARTLRTLLAAISDQPFDAVRAGAAAPRVSCIMPTRNRRPFVDVSIGMFTQRTYANCELIIVDDGPDSVADLAQNVPNVRHVRLREPVSLGEKRNLACDVAEGDIILHWDDDDWYGRERIAQQVAALLDGDGDVVALAMRYLLELGPFKFWKCLPQAHSRVHFRDLCPGTIAYWRTLWSRGRGYPATNCAEDVGFLRALPTTTRITRLPDEQYFVCVRHGANTWQISRDWQRDPRGWSEIEPPEFMPEAERSLLRSLRDKLRVDHV